VTGVFFSPLKKGKRSAPTKKEKKEREETERKRKQRLFILNCGTHVELLKKKLCWRWSETA
jgi:hypothetical protein